MAVNGAASAGDSEVAAVNAVATAADGAGVTVDGDGDVDGDVDVTTMPRSGCR